MIGLLKETDFLLLLALPGLRRANIDDFPQPVECRKLIGRLFDNVKGYTNRQRRKRVTAVLRRLASGACKGIIAKRFDARVRKTFTFFCRIGYEFEFHDSSLNPCSLVSASPPNFPRADSNSFWSARKIFRTSSSL